MLMQWSVDMPLLKALQNTGLGPEHFEYVKAMQLYKQACKRYARVPKDFRFSDNPLKRLQFFNEQELYKLECKRYHLARGKWLEFKAEQKLGAELTPAKIAELLRIEIPSTQQEIEADIRREATANSFKPGEFEQLQNEVRERAGMSVKEQFKASHTVSDPTDNDFEPLPDNKDGE